MDFRNYFTYKVFENGSVINDKGVVLKPQKNNRWLFYELSINGKTKRVGCANIVLVSFGIYPSYFNQKIKHIDGNNENNSLNNLKW